MEQSGSPSEWQDDEDCLPSTSSFITPGRDFSPAPQFDRTSTHQGAEFTPERPGNMHGSPHDGMGLMGMRVASAPQAMALHAAFEAAERLHANRERASHPEAAAPQQSANSQTIIQADRYAGLPYLDDQQQHPVVEYPAHPGSRHTTSPHPSIPHQQHQQHQIESHHQPPPDAAPSQHAERMSALDNSHAVVMQLERSNHELQRRMAALLSELQESEQKRMVAQDKEQSLKEAASEAEAKVVHREQALVMLQKHCDAATAELRGCLLELRQERERAAAGRDEIAGLHDTVEDLKKALGGAMKKVDHVGEDDRRQQAELLQLRREHQALQDALQRCRVDLAEAREKLTRTEGDAGRQLQLAARATAESGGAVVQLHALKTRVQDLEARNSQLLSELVSSREDGRDRSMANSGAIGADRSSAARTSHPPPYAHAHMAAASPYRFQYGADPMAASAGPVPLDASRRDSLATGRAGPPAGVRGNKSESLKSLLYSGVAVAGGGGGEAFSSPTYVAAAVSPGRSMPPQAQHALDNRFSDVQPPMDHYDQHQPLGMGAGGYRSAAPGGGPGFSGSGWLAPAHPAQSGGAEGLYGSRGPERAAPYVKGPGPADGNAYYGAPSRPPVNQQGGEQWKNIEARLSELQAAEDAIKARLAAQDRQHVLGARLAAAAGPNPPSRPGGAAEQVPPGYYRGPAAYPGSAMDSTGYMGQMPSSRPAPYTSAALEEGLSPERGISPQQLAEPNDVGAPFGTDRNAKEMMARSKHLEDGLVALCGEKSLLECELNKMSAGSGRSIKERRRKAEVQQRLETICREISGSRVQLKKLTGKWVSGG